MNKKISSISTPYVCAGKKLCAPIRGRAGKILLAAARFKKSADVKSRIGIFEAVRDVECEALTLLRLYESEASFDGVCNQLKVFAAHNLSSLSRVHLNNKNGFSMVKVFFSEAPQFCKRERRQSSNCKQNTKSFQHLMCAWAKNYAPRIHGGASKKL